MKPARVARYLRGQGQRTFSRITAASLTPGGVLGTAVGEAEREEEEKGVE